MIKILVMTIKLGLVGIFVVFSLSSSILIGVFTTSNVIGSAIPQVEERKHAIGFAPKGVGIGSNPEEKTKHRNKKA